MHILSIYCTKYFKFCASLNLVIIYILLNLIFLDCRGQLSFTISKPRIKISNNNLLITYDILGAKPDDVFNIWLEVTDVLGTEISANTIKGDIGQNIRAGVNKRIVWDIKTDKVSVDNTVNIEIIAERISLSETGPEIKDLSLKGVKSGKYILQSAILPGWGLTSLTNGKPYWLIGAAGIGCIASSVYYNQKAHSSYDKYLNSSADNITGFYDDAIKQGNISKVFAVSAAIIWIADLGAVGIKANSMNKSSKNSKLGAFSINSGIDVNIDSPILILQYKF